MIIPSDRILVGLTERQLKRIVLPALRSWEGPLEGAPRTPAEKDYKKELMKEASELIKEIIKIVGDAR